MLVDSPALKVARVKLRTEAVPSNLREDCSQAHEWLQELAAATLL